jgi:hypothetical protein
LRRPATVARRSIGDGAVEGSSTTTVTITTTTADGLCEERRPITITGVGVAAYDGTFTVSAATYQQHGHSRYTDTAGGDLNLAKSGGGTATDVTSGGSPDTSIGMGACSGEPTTRP